MGRTITFPGGCIQGSPSICTGISDFNLMLICNEVKIIVINQKKSIEADE